MASNMHDPIGYVLGWIFAVLLVVGVGWPVVMTIVYSLWPVLFWVLLFMGVVVFFYLAKIISDS